MRSTADRSTSSTLPPRPAKRTTSGVCRIALRAHTTRELTDFELPVEDAAGVAKTTARMQVPESVRRLALPTPLQEMVPISVRRPTALPVFDAYCEEPARPPAAPARRTTGARAAFVLFGALLVACSVASCVVAALLF